MLPSGNATDASYSPTFNSYFNVTLAETAARVTTEFAGAHSSEDFSSDEEEEEDFEFDLSHLMGEIRPVYPVFNQDLLRDFQLVGEIEPRPSEECSRAQVQLRNLFLEDHEYGDLEGYCVWVPKEPPVASPSPGRCTKSNSTGSSATKGKAKAKAWKLRDLLKRSKSDGKEGLMLLTPKKTPEAPAARRSTATASSDGSVKKPTTVRAAAAAAREGYYGGAEGRRRSYLPYKQDLVGFFASPQSHRKIHLPPF